MKTKELKKLIEYWPDDGEVHIEGCELEEHDIWCVAADPEWRKMNLVKLEDLEVTESKTKFGIKVDNHYDGAWSFGMCLSHWYQETYIFINFWKWSISIGKLTIDES